MVAAGGSASGSRRRGLSGRVVGSHPLHLFLRAQDHRGALVKLLRLQVEDPLAAVGGGAPRLLDQAALVQLYAALARQPLTGGA